MGNLYLIIITNIATQSKLLKKTKEFNSNFYFQGIKNLLFALKCFWTIRKFITCFLLDIIRNFKNHNASMPSKYLIYGHLVKPLAQRQSAHEGLFPQQSYSVSSVKLQSYLSEQSVQDG